LTSGRNKQEKIIEGEGVLLNFDNADIYEVIQVIAATLDINYIIDPQVKGVVNIRSGKKIPTSQLLSVFKKILHINGLDIRSEGDYDYIYVNKKLSAQIINNADQAGNVKEGSEVIIQVIPILHLSAKEAVKLVDPYLSPQGTIYTIPDQNTLLICDYSSKVLDILTLLSRLDISPLASLTINVIKIENAPLYDLRDELNEIFTAMGINKKDFEGISVIPLERVNSLLLISKNEELIKSTLQWVYELDVVPSQDRDNIYIYNVRNSVSSELAELVNSLISEDNPKSKTSKRSSTKSKIKSSKNIKKSVKSKSAAAKSKPPLSSLRFVGVPMLLADDGRNIILIRALPADYSRLVKLLERLDNLPRQVLVEVMVAEISLDDGLEFGVEWAFHNNNLKVNGSQYEQNFITNFAGLAAKNMGFVYNILDSGGDPVAVLNALSSKTDVTILSSPQVLVLNNETAKIDVGREVPIVTTETYRDTTNISTDSVDKTVEYKNTGIILEVTPKINYNGIIILDVDQEVSTAEKNITSGINSPIIAKRKVTTKMAVKDGQSILIGGLIRNETNIIETGVPFLMDIPLLGYFFKYKEESKAKRELLIMITPHVIETEDVLDQYIREFKEKVKGLREKMMGREDN
jgi:general secretion pathway protein D